MTLALVAAAVVLAAALFVVLYGAPAHAHVPARGGHQLHLTARFLLPTSRAGDWALWAVTAGVVAQGALAARVSWGGAPFGALAALLALVALGRHQERSPLVPLALVVGLFAALLPAALWAVGAT
jgi:hypothetical protein